MDVLVIGGTGVISTGITRQLVAAGHNVTILNRGETSVALPSTVNRVTADRYDPDAFTEAVDDISVDVAIDMLCFDREHAETAIDAFEGIEQYILTSTVDVYERPPERNPIDESATRAPVTDYAAGKIAAEDAIMDAHGDAFAATVIRPWSTYGEGGPVLHTFGTDPYYVGRIRRGDPIVVHGDGTSLWGPCHRDDVARAYVGAVGNRIAYGETYHVTSAETITWNQYHQRVATALDAPDPDLVHVPTDVLREVAPDRTEMLRDHFQYSTVFDDSKARRDLGFRYTIGFEEGVRRTVAALDDDGAVPDAPTEEDGFEDRLLTAWRSATDDVVAAMNE
ncbi:NAD-dependent epimerase/dehydratase family protein [Halococcoides cellulosivorans]|uniref:Epimerase n=1 Tax=Halococcoides cellulosivorans TaxID=1679096 RepID=A0A2R4WYJ3_9EURY|nr:NAD-dependent epimerase/dehydratase family protein [Halococcoides cellulosivorans]AWB26613.1 epimerase [Halococcoides cellulosivorans]